MELLFPVYEFRPLSPLEECLRYNGGDWIPDDGEYDLAFIGRAKSLSGSHRYPANLYVRVPYQRNILWSWIGSGEDVPEHPNKNPWHYMLRNGETEWGNRWDKHKHPNVIAADKGSSKCGSIYSCANGGGPDFNINDPYIKAGLLRERETKKIVTIPEKFICMYCGEIDWEEEDEG